MGAEDTPPGEADVGETSGDFFSRINLRRRIAIFLFNSLFPDRR
jgi:hypothetical protein